MEHIGGMVERITYENEENGFCVIKIKSKGYSDVTVVGNLAAVNVKIGHEYLGEIKKF